MYGEQGGRSPLRGSLKLKPGLVTRLVLSSLSTSTFVMLNEANKAGPPKTLISQDTSEASNVLAFRVGRESANLISKQNKFLAGLYQHISGCVVPFPTNFIPGPNAIDLSDESISKSPEETAITEVRPKVCGSSDPNRVRLYSFDEIDHVMRLLSKRHRVAKTTAHAQSTHFFLDQVVKPISPDPTKEIEAPLLSFYKMLDRNA